MAKNVTKNPNPDASHKGKSGLPKSTKPKAKAKSHPVGGGVRGLTRSSRRYWDWVFTKVEYEPAWWKKRQLELRAKKGREGLTAAEEKEMEPMNSESADVQGGEPIVGGAKEDKNRPANYQGHLKAPSKTTVKGKKVIDKKDQGKKMKEKGNGSSEKEAGLDLAKQGPRVTRSAARASRGQAA